MSLSPNILMERFFPSLGNLTLFKKIILVFLGTGLLTLSAKLQIPLTPVKISMQTFVVIFLGCMYGSRLALATVILYLAEGALGMPVFQGTPDRGLGLAYMVGPTGGYLAGFTISAYCIGLLAERGYGRTVSSAAFLFILGAILIDIPGLTWLSYLMSFEKALLVFYSYQIAFLLKVGLGATLVPALWNLSSKQKLY